MNAKRPVLIAIQGPNPGARYELPESQVTSIGRSSRNRISLVNSTISRFHCEVAFINGQWYLTDLNSKKGTLVNGEKVTGRVPLSPGDLVRISNVVFRFERVGESVHDDEALLAVKSAELDV